MRGSDAHIALLGTRGFPLARDALLGASGQAAVSPMATTLLHCFLEQGRDWLAAASYFPVFFCSAMLESKPFSARTEESLLDLFDVDAGDVSETAGAEKALGSLFGQFSTFLGGWMEALSDDFPKRSDALLAEMCAREAARRLAAAKLSAAWLLSSFDGPRDGIEIIGVAGASEDWLPSSLVTVPKDSIPPSGGSAPYEADAEGDSRLLSMLAFQSYAWTNRSWGKAQRAAEALIDHACGWAWFISSDAGNGLAPSESLDRKIREGAYGIASPSGDGTIGFSALVSMPEFQELVSLSAQREKARSWEEMFSVAEAYAQGLPSYGPNALGALAGRISAEGACSPNHPATRGQAIFDAGGRLKEALAKEFPRIKSHWKKAMREDAELAEHAADGAWISWFDGGEIAFDIELEEPS